MDISLVNCPSVQVRETIRKVPVCVCVYEFIGQNKVSLTVDTPHIHTLTVPEGRRIAVRTGDIIALLYGAKRLGVSFSVCNGNTNPESNHIYWFEPLTPDTAVQGKVYSFSYTPVWLCRIFSFRAVVVTQVIPTHRDFCHACKVESH